MREFLFRRTATPRGKCEFWTTDSGSIMFLDVGEGASPDPTAICRELEEAGIRNLERDRVMSLVALKTWGIRLRARILQELDRKKAALAPMQEKKEKAIFSIQGR